MIGNLSLMYRFVGTSMYTSTSAWITNDSIPDDNSTYVFTYYQSAGNPYTTLYPSWSIVKQASNVIPMKDADAYILYTTPYHAITANLQLQYNILGHCIQIIDYGANLSTQQISLTSSSGAYIDGFLTKVYK